MTGSRARLLVSVAMLLASPAWSQQQTAQDADAARQAAEDQQLPAYLRRNASAAETLAYDPWEHFNRRVYRFNQHADHLGKWAAHAYVEAVPEPARDGVSRFFVNLRQPASAVNLLLQGHPASACQTAGRFVVNLTIGIGGLFDPATRMRIPAYEEDFGQTLGHWGWRRSRYLVVPFLGPATLRDGIGSIVDSPLSVTGYVRPVAAEIGLVGLQLVDRRAQLLEFEDLRGDLPVADEYVLVREAWSQRRMHQIDDQDPVEPAGEGAR